MRSSARARWPAPTLGLAALGIGLVAASAAPNPTAAAAPPDDRGYWLSAVLGSTREPDRVAALARLQPDATGVPPSDPDIPGVVVGRVFSIEDAMTWVVSHAFETAVGEPAEPTMLREAGAPIPGGALLREHDAPLLRIIVTGADAERGLRPIVWPRSASDVLPPDASWATGQLVPARAPVFAAPAPRLPPARERIGIARRDGYVFRLGTLDRCEGDDAGRTCLRWAQVVARVGDRFVSGYLPAFLLADPGAWVRGATAYPAVQVVYSGVDHGQAQILVLAHAPDGARHHARVEAPLVDGRLPAASVGLAGATATLTIEGQPARRLPLDASLDRYPRD